MNILTSKNNDPAKANEIPLDIEEMRVELGIVEIERQLEEIQNSVSRLQNSLGEWLVYFNMMDRRVQELSGEKVITEKLSYNAQSDGHIQLLRHRPPVPNNLLEGAPGPVKRTTAKK